MQVETDFISPKPRLRTLEVSCDEVIALTTACLARLGYLAKDAARLTDILLYAERRGSSQGLLKLLTGGLGPDPRAAPPRIEHLKTFPYAAKLHGNWSHAMLTTDYATEKAIEIAKGHGIAIIGISEMNSSSGALGYYVQRMAQEGCIGILTANTPAKVAPHGACVALFGTNPLAIGIPRKENTPLVVDMATAAIAWYEVMKRAEEGISLPSGQAFDSGGLPTCSAQAALGGAIAAFGGAKGSALACVIELLAGAFVGAETNKQGKAKQNWGALMIAVRADLFGNRDELEQAANQLAHDIHALPAAGPGGPARLPGERGEILAQSRKIALPLTPQTYAALRNIAGKNE